MRRLITMTSLALFLFTTGCPVRSITGEEGALRFTTGDDMTGRFPYAIGTGLTADIAPVFGNSQEIEWSTLLVRSSDDLVMTAELELPVGPPPQESQEEE